MRSGGKCESIVAASRRSQSVVAVWTIFFSEEVLKKSIVEYGNQHT
jgi:hypothetical protein